MMKRSLITACCAIALILPSCSTINKTATTVDIPTSIVSRNEAELQVNDKRISFTYKPSRQVRRGGMNNVLNAAIAEALKANGDADVLVAMQYEMKISTGFFGQKTVKYVTVSGHPAFYKNVHPEEPQQYILMNGSAMGTCTNFKPIK